MSTKLKIIDCYSVTGGISTGLLLIEGFVSVSIQMIVLRQLVPAVGYSINVTSIVITIFLAALALGYRRGGKIRQEFESKIANNMLLVAVLAGVGLSFASVDWFFEVFFEFSSSPLLGTAIYSALFMGPVVYLLAQTVLLLVNFRAPGDASEKAGDTFHLSTIGNVVGGLITTLVIMYYFGVGAAIVFDVVLLLVGYLLVRRIDNVYVVGVVCFVLFLSFFINVVHENRVFYRTTAHANYYMTTDESSGADLLVVNGQNASRSTGAGIGHPYIEWFEDEIVDDSDRESILVLGAGGFSFGQGREHQSEITFVDLDDKLGEIADEFLRGKSRGGVFVAQDARAFLIQSDVNYDNIVVDVFSHHSSVPFHLVTREFFELVRARLVEDGVVLFNFIVSDADGHRFSRGIDNTIRSVFANCSTHSIRIANIPLFNRLYRCQRSVLDDYKAVFTDRNTKASVDGSMR